MYVLEEPTGLISSLHILLSYIVLILFRYYFGILIAATLLLSSVNWFTFTEVWGIGTNFYMFLIVALFRTIRMQHLKTWEFFITIILVFLMTLSSKGDHGFLSVSLFYELSEYIGVLQMVPVSTSYPNVPYVAPFIVLATPRRKHLSVF